MNFLAAPLPGLVENSDMTADERAAAIHYVDELQGLSAVARATEPLLNNGPLFLVAKTLGPDGKPLDFRCISDMRKGRQNG